MLLAEGPDAGGGLASGEPALVRAAAGGLEPGSLQVLEDCGAEPRARAILEEGARRQGQAGCKMEGRWEVADQGGRFKVLIPVTRNASGEAFLSKFYLVFKFFVVPFRKSHHRCGF